MLDARFIRAIIALNSGAITSSEFGVERERFCNRHNLWQEQFKDDKVRFYMELVDTYTLVKNTLATPAKIDPWETATS